MMLAMVYLSCSEPKDQELGDPIINPSFSFLQDVNKLYFSVNVESTFEGEKLDSVLVFWHGISREGSPDKFTLNDGGVQGDIIMNANAGDFVIFPADVLHSVEQNKFDTPRISLSLNIKFELN